MLIFEGIDPIKTHLSKLKFNNKSIGFVPTMGALHDGHISLIQASKAENDITVCSIYINPTQFNKDSDLNNYPRVLEQDVELLHKSDCDILFTPSDQEIYAQKPILQLNFGYLETLMEGKFRNGHFNGVGIIVAKLLNIVQPTNIYFGQKDLQQYLIIRQLVKDLSFDVNLICLPIVREPDGLAMSSRNLRLSKANRKLATSFYEVLLKAKRVILENSNIALAKSFVNNYFVDSDVIKLEYFEVLDSNTLKIINNLEDHPHVSLFIAGYIGEIRLIDNIYLHSS
jgi:pantoate--beta-alanine ligase